MQKTWDTGSIPRSGRFPGGRHGNPLQYSCLENPMDRGDWWAMVYRVAKNQTRLKRFSGGLYIWNLTFCYYQFINFISLTVKYMLYEKSFSIVLHISSCQTHRFRHMACCMPNHFSHVQFFVILWTVAHQAPLSVGLSRQEYWSGLSYPPPGDLPHPGFEPVSFMCPALADRFFTTSTTWESLGILDGLKNISWSNFQN